MNRQKTEGKWTFFSPYKVSKKEKDLLLTGYSTLWSCSVYPQNASAKGPFVQYRG